MHSKDYGPVTFVCKDMVFTMFLKHSDVLYAVCG